MKKIILAALAIFLVFSTAQLFAPPIDCESLSDEIDMALVDAANTFNAYSQYVDAYGSDDTSDALFNESEQPAETADNLLGEYNAMCCDPGPMR